jgi:hypothetical protein
VARALRAKLGADHADTLKSEQDVAESQLSIGRADQALATLEDCLKRASVGAADQGFVKEIQDLRDAAANAVAAATTRLAKN